MADIGDILCPLVRTARPPISLARFKEGPSIYKVWVRFIIYIRYCVHSVLCFLRSQLLRISYYSYLTSTIQPNGSGSPTVHLRAILGVITRRFHKIPVSVHTRQATNGSFHTSIKGDDEFERKYKATKTMTLFEVEAVAICRFLRPATNVLGYSVVDQNYPILARLVSDMNRFGEQMAELQICVAKAGGMVHRAHESIKDVHEILKLQVPPQDIQALNALVDGLLAIIEGYCTAMDRAVAAFRH